MSHRKSMTIHDAVTGTSITFDLGSSGVYVIVADSRGSRAKREMPPYIDDQVIPDLTNFLLSGQEPQRLRPTEWETR